MQEGLITFRASRGIIVPTRNCDDEMETGGLMAGTFDPLTIVDAGGPGPESIHLPAQFTSDPQADAECLSKARKDFGPKIQNIGHWHKQPGNNNRPSSGDCLQAQQLLEEYADGKPIIIGIVNRIPRLLGHRTTLYLYRYDENGLCEISWKLTKTNGPELLSAIEKAPINPHLKTTNFWNDDDFQFYQNQRGRQRIKQELDRLKDSGWLIKTKRQPHDKTLLLEMVSDKLSLQMILPPEYPLNPPIVFNREGARFCNLQVISQWNSLHSLTDIVTEYELKARMYCC